MNSTTRETLERLAIQRLRTMDHLSLGIKRAQAEIERLRKEVNAEAKRVDEYLDTIAAADPSFNKDAWLNHAKREWVI